MLGNDVIEAIRGSKFFAEITDQQKAAAAARRREVAAELKRHEASAEKTLGRQDKALEDAIAAVRAAEQSVIALRNKAVSLRAEKTAASFAYTARHDELTRELIQTADPLISEFKRWCNEESAKLRKVAITPDGPARIQDPLTGLWRDAPKNEPSTHERVIARLSALRDAIAAADELALRADQNDVAAELQLLRDKLPRL